jgi:hypothetical protein
MDVFNSTYDNYRIFVIYRYCSGGSNIDLKLRLSGTDNSDASSYKHQLASFDGGSSNIGLGNA